MNEAIINLAAAARKLLRDWRKIAALVVVFGALLTVSYLFVSTREASAAQLALTVLLGAASVYLYFTAQAMGVTYAVTNDGVGAWLKRAALGAARLFVVTLPIVALGALLAYLFARLDASSMMASADGADWPWKRIALAALWYVVFIFALPLAAIHLWAIAARESLGAAFRGFGAALRRSIAGPSVLIYLLGFLAFAVLPYFMLTTRTPINRPWAEIGTLGLRLALSFLVILVGWVITLGALSLRAGADATTATATPPPPADPVPAQ